MSSLVKMELPVIYPTLKEKSTKDYILRLLIVNNSLTNQQIFRRIKKEYGFSVTYQTVRQALLELVDKGILDKTNKDYSISKKWIFSMNNLISILKRKYIDNREVKFIDKDTKEINLRSLNDLGHFVLYSFRNYFFDAESQHDLFMFVQHLWFPFSDKRKRDLLSNFFSANNNYIFVGKPFFLDKILSKYYRKFGNVIFNKRIDEFFDIIIQGGCIAKIYIPRELRSKMDKTYKFSSLSFNLIEKLEDLTYSEYPIKIIITRNRNMANEIKEKCLK